jgi:hypothetical protein
MAGEQPVHDHRGAEDVPAERAGGREGGEGFGRRSFLGLASAAGVAVAAPSVRLASRTASSALRDEFSRESTFRTPTGWYGAPIHSTLMPSGHLLLMGYQRPTSHPTDATLTDPLAWLMPAPLPRLGSEYVLTPLGEPLQDVDAVSDGVFRNDDLFCAGHTLTADGVFFSAGGTRNARQEPSLDLIAVTGLDYATMFNGRHWRRLRHHMEGKGATGHPNRWYPTVTRLPDERLLVTSGFDLVIPTPSVNRSIEAFDPATETFEVVAPFPELPAVAMASDYTHVFVLPFRSPGDVVMFGEPGIPVFFSLTTKPSFAPEEQEPRPETEAWQAEREKNGNHWISDTAPGEGASTAMLPLYPSTHTAYSSGSVSLYGGPLGSKWMRHFDVFDPWKNSWHATVHTKVARSNPAQVMLPDGNVALMNGHSDDPDIGKVELVDTIDGFTTRLGQADCHQQRGYHNVATLLPDGSVFVAGGRSLETPTSFEKPTFRYWYPAYMRAARPRILDAPTRIGYRAGFSVTVDAREHVGEIVLVALGSMTHCIDMNQRVVRCKVHHVSLESRDRYVVEATGPEDTRVAPAGDYMLFAVDKGRVPSRAVFVRVT